MFSECDDDLCIFVCGTCKRYFTQLSAFSQHKKERLCMKKSPGGLLVKDKSVGQHCSQDTSEENEVDGESVAETTPNIGEAFNDAEDNSQRKYPRKQDKKLIKRTIRELENESLLCPEGKVNVSSLYTPVSRDSHADNNTLASISPEMQRSCKHPIYVCKTCHAEFPNTNGRVFKCVDCRRGFYTEADLNQHMVRAKHNNLCAVCGKIFPDKYKLRKHELSHVTEKNFRCEEPGCTKSFKSAEDVRTHVRYVHAVEKRFHCTHCFKAFTRLDKFKLHMNTHGISMKPGPISPNHTGIPSLGTNSLGSNVLALKAPPGDETPGTLALYHSSSTESGGNVTEVVQTVEVAAGDANSHPSPGHEHNAMSSEVDVGGKSDTLEGGSAIVAYSSSSDFTNSVGNYDKPTGSQMNESMDSSAASQSEAGQECEKCLGCFQTSIDFLAHEERRADHVLRCEHCSAKFLSFCELRSHVRGEHGVQFLPEVMTKPPPETPKKERKHFCQECGKGFTRPDKLKRHVIIHSPDRPCIPCVCKESHGCERTFYRNDSMKRHALTHTLDKPYTCEECGKNFSRPDYLTKHVGHVHKRAFKHLCTLCDYGTREAKRLKIHIRSKHELDPDLFLATDGPEGALGPSMANAGDTVAAGTADSPVDSQSPSEIDQAPRDLTSPNEHMNISIGQINTGQSHPTKIIPGEFSPRGMNTGEITPRDLTMGEIESNPSDLDPRELVPQTGQMTPNGGHLVPSTGETTPNIDVTNSAVIEPLTNDLSPPEMQHGMEMDRHSRDVSPRNDEIHQATGDIDPGDRYQRSGIETPGALGSPQGSESPSPVTRQSVISQDLGVPELRLLPEFQDVTRHNFNDRRSSDFIGDQSVRSRYPYAYPPQDMRPQYSMPGDFTAFSSHQSGLTQFPPHQSVFSNVHMQFPGGAAHLPNYERKTPLNSRPVSSQSPFNWRT